MVRLAVNVKRGGGLDPQNKVAYNPNTCFLNWKQRTAGKAVEDALQYIKMYVAEV